MDNIKRQLANELVYVNNSWHDVLVNSLCALDYTYLKFLKNNDNYFPDKDNFLNAFTRIDLPDVKYILFGQDPYPRKESAIGEAFIDGAVKSLWDEKGGLSKAVNRATSLRNIMKMLLYAEGLIKDDFSPVSIRKVDKNGLISSIYDLRDNFVKNGVLLLNAALIHTTPKESSYHIKKWQPFIKVLLKQLNNSVSLILLGNFAKDYVGKLPEAKTFEKLTFEHPFNTSFITNPEVVRFFGSMHLIRK